MIEKTFKSFRFCGFYLPRKLYMRSVTGSKKAVESCSKPEAKTLENEMTVEQYFPYLMVCCVCTIIRTEILLIARIKHQATRNISACIKC